MPESESPRNPSGMQPAETAKTETAKTETAETETLNQQTFRTSALIRITLLSFYSALMAPLPILAQVTAAPVPPAVLAIGIFFGGLVLHAALTERVLVDEASIQVTYAQWVPSVFRQGWQLEWTDIIALKPRSTGQGGIVYYFLSQTAERAYLLPMRVAGFSKLVSIVQAKTGINTQNVRPLSQPWMYLILLTLTLLLLLMDGWTVSTALGG